MLTRQGYLSQRRHAWLVAAIFAFLLFLGNVAVEVLGDELKEKLRPYRFWVWLVLVVSLAITIIGTIREAGKRQDSGDDSASKIANEGDGNIVSYREVTTLNQLAGNSNAVNQSRGGDAKVEVNVYPKSLPNSGGPSVVNVDDKRCSTVHWEHRDGDLLKEYFAKCAEFDGLCKNFKSWQDRDVRERLVVCGLAAEDHNGHTYLTYAGVLFCCQKGKIPQSTFHVDVRFRQFTIANESALQINGCSLLLLYNQILRELTPFFERSLELPSIRDDFGSAVAVTDYPKVAVIEALVNFLIHRDYAQDDMGFITVYPDKLVFENPGQSEFSAEELLTATEPLKPKYPRNQRLIQAFNEARLNQREGRGIQRIREALKENRSLLQDGSIGLEIKNDHVNNRFILTIHKRPQSIPMQRPNEKDLKAAVERLLAGTEDQHDRSAIKQAFLEGRIAYSGAEKNLAISDGVSATVVVTGDQNSGPTDYNKATLDLDEHQYEHLRATIFPVPPGIPPPISSQLFLGREEALSDIKAMLGMNDESAQARLAIVRGWPGVGKTTLASVLSRDADLARMYPDGVLWTSLGQRTELMSILAEWGRALGTDQVLRMPLIQDATKLIASLLQNKRILLIVDDVWNSDSGALFLQLQGRHCGLLITTRSTEVANSLAPSVSSVYNLPILDEEAAFKLIQLLASEAGPQHHGEYRELVRDLEYLPLAIHVAGRLLREEARMGFGVSDLLSGLRDGAALFQAKAPADRVEDGVLPTVAALLKRSTDALDEHTRECFVFLGAFAPKPATFDLKAMEAVWQVEDPRPIVRKLVSYGLLEPVGNGRFQMHALLVAHARSLLEN